ncbi:MAG: hypothetical protein M1837_003715 [Sclerophora amabilis]|nr:MAG: hypothetical protein M1837_003715 [Sclerophora amabilis]
MAQGFYSDGMKYSFMCIRNNGSVMFSRMFNLLYTGNLKTVFNCLVTMIATAGTSAPPINPTKPAAEQAEQVVNFDQNQGNW